MKLPTSIICIHGLKRVSLIVATLAATAGIAWAGVSLSADGDIECWDADNNGVITSGPGSYLFSAYYNCGDPGPSGCYVGGMWYLTKGNENDQNVGETTGNYDANDGTGLSNDIDLNKAGKYNVSVTLCVFDSGGVNIWGFSQTGVNVQLEAF